MYNHIKTIEASKMALEFIKKHKEELMNRAGTNFVVSNYIMRERLKEETNNKESKET